ncbi:TetR/AcrR family transcriptional regulator [Pseudomonas sp. CAU 1711]|uniref:TetR/AcrR family transcriptional regulator n=1 Tax=Pseudomonas sp. CAU 1711 TaxID=3140356 RepID=UPI0032607C04
MAIAEITIVIYNQITIYICQSVNNDSYLEGAMRHKGVNKDETRRKVIEAVSRGFRRHGYAGVGVDRLAKDAGVTSGAFYANFGSKSGAFEVALALGLDEVIEGVPRFQREHGAGWVQAFTGYYLGKAHREDRECGCAMAALTPEVARADAELRQAFEDKMTLIAELIARGLDCASAEQGHARAWALLGVLIGGLNMARALRSDAAVDGVVRAIEAAALQAAGPGRAVADSD